MKRIIEVAEDEAFVKLLGSVVTLFCANYIYTGQLDGVNDTHLVLSSASIVYETGPFDQKGWKDAQRLPGDEWCVQIAAIESWGILK